jgi:hypothetical protein
MDMNSQLTLRQWKLGLLGRFPGSDERVVAGPAAIRVLPLFTNNWSRVQRENEWVSKSRGGDP